MTKWAQYSAIKELVTKYAIFKDGKEYDEFIQALTEILEI